MANWNNKISLTALSSFLFCLLISSPKTTQCDEINTLVDKIVAKNNAIATAQKKIDKIDDETFQLITRYREIQRQLESLRVYNKQVKKLTSDQYAEMESFQEEINDTAMMARNITPLMFRMVNFLEQFIDMDTPFLQEERSKRMATLKEMMNQSDVSDSEKFRRILEAYQIENEYGRTIEAYKADLVVDSKKRTVEFLRIGRVVLIYRTIDGGNAGVWNQSKTAWEKLGDEYNNAVRQGFRIARKQTAPDLIELPVPAAKEVAKEVK